MKKNRTMRIAAVLMVLTLMTSCFVGGTFAKYTTGDFSQDSARVAKWGVTVTGQADDMFKNVYGKTDSNYTLTANTVVSEDPNEDVVAPGTNGTLTTFGVTGTPEVAVEVTYTVDVFNLNNWSIDLDGVSGPKPAEDYCPIIFTVNGVELYIGGNDLGGNTIADITGLKEAVVDAIVAKKAYYEPGEDLSIVDDDLTVGWKWQFDNTTDVDFGKAHGQSDIKDTCLGNWTTNAPEIELKVTCTVTQVD